MVDVCWQQLPPHALKTQCSTFFPLRHNTYSCVLYGCVWVCIYICATSAQSTFHRTHNDIRWQKEYKSAFHSKQIKISGRDLCNVDRDDYLYQERFFVYCFAWNSTLIHQTLFLSCRYSFMPVWAIQVRNVMQGPMTSATANYEFLLPTN